ncbi:type II toxin-antitoxin system RelE/ParE family toxin [Chromatiaceae bacterium AAb-1]|nr:type II toxin-antitoxin system RelE/ParE family toxin [Chromatiaceae bacterium AAb-1]
MKIIIARSALNDLQEIKAYYLGQGVPEVGQQFVDIILEKLQRLIDFPDSGRKVPEFDQEQIREIIHPPFRIVYLRNTSTINLVRVWRSEKLLLLPAAEI